MRNFTVAAGALLALSGCAPQVVLWERSGATQSEFNQDKYACAREATSQASYSSVTGGYRIGNTWVPVTGSSESGQTISQPVLSMCMEARGYTQHARN